MWLGLERFCWSSFSRYLELPISQCIKSVAMETSHTLILSGWEIYNAYCFLRQRFSCFSSSLNCCMALLMLFEVWHTSVVINTMKQIINVIVLLMDIRINLIFKSMYATSIEHAFLFALLSPVFRNLEYDTVRESNCLGDGTSQALATWRSYRYCLKQESWSED